jgi:hypothetical protein
MPSVFEKMLNHVRGHRPSAPPGLMKANKYQTHNRERRDAAVSEARSRGRAALTTLVLMNRVRAILSNADSECCLAYARASETDHWN